MEDSWVIIRDFNLIHFCSERKGSVESNKPSAKLNDLIDDLQLMEIKLNQFSFTWSNHKENPVLVKLDRYLVSMEWAAAFPSHILRSLAKTTSDHCPLLLETFMQKNTSSHFEDRF